MAPHVPSFVPELFFAALHATQGASHAPSQQTPSTQKPLAHCAATPHFLPVGARDSATNRPRPNTPPTTMWSHPGPTSPDAGGVQVPLVGADGAIGPGSIPPAAGIQRAIGRLLADAPVLPLEASETPTSPLPMIDAGTPAGVGVGAEDTSGRQALGMDAPSDQRSADAVAKALALAPPARSTSPFGKSAAAPPSRGSPRAVVATKAPAPAAFGS
jgi:hypothetical protein